MDYINEKVKQRFMNPVNAGGMKDADGTGSAGNLSECGDFIEIFIKIEGNAITDATFLATGCPSAIASADAATELAKGRTIFEAASVDNVAVDKALGGLPSDKKNCSNLGTSALKAALEDYISSERFSGVEMMDGRVAVAMSGGVDSSTAAAVLKREGFDVIGVTMRLHDNLGYHGDKTCCSPSDLADAADVASKMGFPHFNLNFKDIFKKNVIDTFLSAYVSGTTPNPCMECNRNLKFTALIEKTAALGASSVATGHYTRILYDRDSKRFLVKKAADGGKDQSYMFWAADQDVLGRFKTPLGDYLKRDTRKIAARMKLAVAEKSESQEICFIPGNDYREFLRSSLKTTPKPGPILDMESNVIGTHRGLPFYTIGQRRGLGIAHERPLYVTKIEVEKNCLIAGEASDFNTRRLTATEANFIPFDRLDSDLKVEVKYRYNMAPVSANLVPIDSDRFLVEFSNPQAGIAPGQSVVAYDNDLVVGGGIIES